MRMSYKFATATAIITQIISQSVCIGRSANTKTNTIRSARIYHRNKALISAFQSYSQSNISNNAEVVREVLNRPNSQRFSLPTPRPFLRSAGASSSSNSAQGQSQGTHRFASTSSISHSRAGRLFSSRLSSSKTDQDQDRGVQMHHFESVKSTQDEARKVLHDSHHHVPNQYFAITASSQTNGRGTNGRSWIGQKGNSFLTIAIPSNDLKIPLTLFPLQVGCIIAQRVQEMIQKGQGHDGKVKDDNKVTVKWPNDVLVNQKKIAGVLIESDQDHAGNYYFLVGIGVNYKYAPEVETTGPQMGREATCICDHIHVHIHPDEDNDDDSDDEGVEASKCLGRDIANDITNWVKVQKTWEGAGDAITANWERFFESGTKLIMRDDPAREVVTSIAVEKDGRLRVRGQDGKERLLCHDYLL